MPEVRIVKCNHQRLHKVPKFENIGHYELLDLRHNSIKFIPDHVFKQFTKVNVRDNPSFICPKRGNPGLLSDCPDMEETPGFLTQVLQLSTPDMFEDHHELRKRDRTVKDGGQEDCLLNSTISWITDNMMDITQTAAASFLDGYVSKDTLLYTSIPLSCSCLLCFILICMRKKLGSLCYRLCRCCHPNRLENRDGDTTFEESLLSGAGQANLLLDQMDDETVFDAASPSVSGQNTALAPAAAAPARTAAAPSASTPARPPKANKME